MRSSNWIEGDSNSGRIVVNPDAIFGNLAADPFRPEEVTDNETLQEVHQNDDNVACRSARYNEICIWKRGREPDRHVSMMPAPLVRLGEIDQLGPSL